MCSQGCGLEKGAEAHCLLRIDGGYVWDGKFVAGPAVVAVGNGTRGSVYAAFALSEHMLGVSPFHKFTFDQPVWTGKSLPLATLLTSEPGAAADTGAVQKAATAATAQQSCCMSAARGW